MVELILDGRMEKDCIVNLLKGICVEYELVKEN